MLVLFAAVALAFVYYAQSEATASRYGREAQTAFRPDMDPELLLSYFLGQLIYGVPNDATGAYSALRGHDLARGVYGYADVWDPNTNVLLGIGVGLNSTPFNGLGRVHDTTTTNFNPPPDDYVLVNYTFYPIDGFLRDPEHAGSRAGLNVLPNSYVGGANPGYTYCDLNTMCLAAVNANGEILQQSFYRPWTGIGSLYWNSANANDPNNNPNWGPGPVAATTKYLTLRPLPSYHTVAGKTSFPPPDDPAGDVKNGEGFLGVKVPGQAGMYYNNDSIWIDIGAPVLTAPDGRKYKALFAALIVDLDGKINLNAAGNIRGQDANGNPIHVSNQGWGAWEVALWRAMLPPGGALPPQWTNLFVGNGLVTGRYGADKQPNAAGTSAIAGEPPHHYAQVDYDGAKVTVTGLNTGTFAPSDKWYLPGTLGNPYPFYMPFPYFPTPGFMPFPPTPDYLVNFGAPAPPNNYTTYGNGTDSSLERFNHPLNFNLFQPAIDDRVFPAREMEALLRFTGTGTPALNSDLFRLCPNDFYLSAQSARIRRLLTTHSFDLTAPGAIPWLWNATAGQPDPNYVLVSTQFPPPTPQYVPPAGGPATPPYSFPPPPLPPTNGEFQTLRRAATAALGRLNLNQTLASYPLPSATTGMIDLTVAANVTQFQQAQQARQTLAQNVFNALCWVTTGQPAPSAAYLLSINPKLTATATAAQAAQYAAYRWLAQLAVNVVDYRDSDNYQTTPGLPLYNTHYSTPFNWDPNYATATTTPGDGWVYGVELSQVLINEAYAEIDNDPNDVPGNVDFLVKFWVELHNPLLQDTNQTDPLNAANPAFNSAARLTLPPALVNPANPYPPYRLVIAQGPQAAWAAGTQFNNPGNPRGDVPAANIKAIVQNWAPPAGFVTAFDTTVVQAANGAYAGTNGTAATGGGNAGFFVVGPSEANIYNFPYDPNVYPGTPPANLPANYPYPTLRLTSTPNGALDPVTNQLFTSGMSYQWPVTIGGVANPVPGPFYHTLVLQRLACPYLPFNNAPFANGAPNPLYNPYVTVDYTDSVPTYDGRTMVAGVANTAVVPYAQRAAWGRKQPYAALSDITYVPPAVAGGPGTYTPFVPVGGTVTDSQLLPQNPDGSATPPTSPPTPYPGEPPHTLFRTNAVGPTANVYTAAQPNPYGNFETVTIPFDWLTHIDRQLVNPAELLMVSACAPSQVTQMFMYSNGPTGLPPPNTTVPFAHLAPWRNPQTRLYRLLEFLGTANRASVTPAGQNRWPGKVNINTIWDPEILDALLDAQPSSYWPTYPAPNNVTTASLLQSLLLSRTPAGVPAATVGQAGGTDRPFLPLSVPFISNPPPAGETQWPNGVSVLSDTVLRNDPADANNQKLLFGAWPQTAANPTGQRSPYLQNEILQKIFNNITTRSNVFAVWVTVGFFEVTDDTVRPVKLGAEIGKAEGRNVRHRMFAIIDRSNLAVPAQLTDSSGNAVTVTAINAGPPQTLTLTAITGSTSAPPPVGVTMNWAIQQGSTIAVGIPGTNLETVTVTAPPVGTTVTTTAFTQTHNAGEPVLVPGPVGPAIPGNPNFLTVLGNPGPQQRYDPRRNGTVVLHFNIIE
jgi:hypothetical protein